MRGGWTYIMANRPRGMLYTGVTAHIAARVQQHREDKGSAFCRRYGLNMLVLAEPHASIEQAIAREKNIKAWKREWKIALVEAANPDWRDLCSSRSCNRRETPAFAGVTALQLGATAFRSLVTAS